MSDTAGNIKREINRISFQELRDELLRKGFVVSNDLELKRLFELNTFMTKVNLNPLDKTIIEDWWKVEEGVLDSEFSYLEGYLFDNLGLQSEDLVIMILDMCFKDKEAYQFKYGEFKSVESILEVIPYNDFMQQFDHIFIFPSKDLIVCMHHEGHVFRYKGLK